MVSVAAVIPSIPAIIMPALIVTVIPALTMSLLITRNVLSPVPIVSYKDDMLTAGIVLPAIPPPIFSMFFWYAQVDRRALHRYPTLNDNRPREDHLRRREVAQVKTTIEAGMPQADRNTNVGSKCRSGAGGSNQRCCDKKTLHSNSPVVRVMKIQFTLDSITKSTTVEDRIEPKKHRTQVVSDTKFPVCRPVRLVQTTFLD
jgi:hypothetical protein